MRDLGYLVIIGLACLVAVSSCGGKQAATSMQGVSMDTLAARNTAFAIDLYRKLGEGNVFFSPYSVSSALAMTYAGAKGKTAEEMARVLHFASLGEEIHKGFGALTDTLNAKGKQGNFKLSIANALWAQQDFTFLDDFVDLTRKFYGAGLYEVDFFHDTEGARQRINTWVAERTEDKIKELIARGLLTPETRLVLTNAIYFLGDWRNPFNEKRTSDEPFHVADTVTVTVPMMHQEGHFHYMEGQGFQMLELPYKGGDLSMVILLPREIGGFRDLEARLTPDSLTAWLGRLSPEQVDITLPRFKLETKFRLDGALSLV